MRCKQMQKWIQKWAPPDLYGGIPLQGTDTASAPVAISVSKATMAKQKLLGASLDYTACFDNIDAELCLLIISRLGLPKEIANATRALHSQLKCIVNVGVAAGDMVTKQRYHTGMCNVHNIVELSHGDLDYITA